MKNGIVNSNSAILPEGNPLMILSLRNGRDISLGNDPKRIKAITAFLSEKEVVKPCLSVDGELINPTEVIGMFKESSVDAPQGSITFVNSHEGLLDDKAAFLEWMVASKSGAPKKLDSKQYYELLEFMKNNKSGKIFVGGRTFDLFDITSITEKSEYDRASLIRMGWWECSLGNLHPRDEKFCDEGVCHFRKMQEDKKEEERKQRIKLNKEKV